MALQGRDYQMVRDDNAKQQNDMENGQKNSQSGAPKRNRALMVAVIAFSMMAIFASIVAIAVVVRAKRVDAPAVEVTEVAYQPKAEGSLAYGDYPFTSTRKVVFHDFLTSGVYSNNRTKFCKQLRIMRNEIFARHGYIFASSDLRSHFEQKEWYTPITKDVKFSAIEKFNVEYIKACEDAIKNPGEGDDFNEFWGFTHEQLTRRKLTENDLCNDWSAEELRVIRNVIYAYHGYIFNDPELREHFGYCWWYRPVTKEVKLSAIEAYNVEFIKRYAKSIWGNNSI